MLQERWGKEKKAKEKEFNSAAHTINQINTCIFLYNMARLDV